MASFKLQIILLPRWKPKFLSKLWEIWGTRSCRNFSPEPVGVQLGMPWLRDEGAVGQASANQAHLSGCLMPNRNEPPQKCRACSHPSYPSLFHDENDPPFNTAQVQALECQPFPAPWFTEVKCQSWVFELQFWSVLLSSHCRETAWGVGYVHTKPTDFTVHTYQGLSAA